MDALADYLAFICMACSRTRITVLLLFIAGCGSPAENTGTAGGRNAIKVSLRLLPVLPLESEREVADELSLTCIGGTLADPSFTPLLSCGSAGSDIVDVDPRLVRVTSDAEMELLLCDHSFTVPPGAGQVSDVRKHNGFFGIMLAFKGDDISRQALEFCRLAISDTSSPSGWKAAIIADGEVVSVSQLSYYIDGRIFMRAKSRADALKLRDILMELSPDEEDASEEINKQVGY